MPRRKKSNWPAGLEPTCWGSAELPLIPEVLERACRGFVLEGFQKRNKNSKKNDLVAVQLSLCASVAWRKELRDTRPVDESVTLVDLVINAIERIYTTAPDSLDVPFVRKPIDGFDNVMFIPFELATWELIMALGDVGEVDVLMLLSGTFRELLDRLGSVRAALDVAVTSQAWLEENENGRYRFAKPDEPDSYEAAVDLLSSRCFRLEGRKPAVPQYSAPWAKALGKRSGIGSTEKWTLDMCGEFLGVTRERVRQVANSRLWEVQPRFWGQPAVIQEIYGALMDAGADDDLVISTGESIPRADGVKMLVDYGYPEDEFQGPWTVRDELELLGVGFSQVRTFAYRESEKTGFIRREELNHHLALQFPALVGEMFDEIVDEIVVMGDLPDGYVYLESTRGSSVKHWLVNLISVLGPQTFDEVYRALVRHHKVRMPGLVFPPRSVILAFVERDPVFWLDEDVLGLAEGQSRELSGIERWLQDTICGCSGQVIHRTELYQLGRDHGVKGGTLNMYTGYSLYFKPVSGGLVTMTGMFPAEVMCELARRRASAIRVPTRRGELVVAGPTVSMSVEVGNDLIDSGVFSSTAEIRGLLSGQIFPAFVNGQQFGRINWSGNQMTGFGHVLRELGAQPGDTVTFTFSLVDGEMTAQFSTSP